MKKRIAVLTSVIMAFSMVLMGCSASDVAAVANAVEEIAEEEMETEKADAQEKSMPEEEKTSEEKSDDGAAGYYRLLSMVEDGEEDAGMAEMGKLGIYMYMVLNEDGTGYYDFAEDKTNMAWDEKYFWDPEDDETEKSEYVYENGKIYVSGDDTEMEFIKLTDEEKDYYLENGSAIDYDKLMENEDAMNTIFGGSEVTDDNDGPAGYYKMTVYIEDGKDSEDYAMLYEMGAYMYLVLNEDGTGVMDLLGDADDLEWDETMITFEDTEPSEYTYEDGKITIEEDETKMVFERLTEEEEEYYIENGSDMDLDDLAS
ncbi:MAG: hypothetical protein K6G22_14365 [Lachnospiraceae bacterium]|nr:hypothetical protein [Lachnospiraceae bacterium]